MQVLIVETDPAEADRLKRRIIGWGHGADTAQTPQAALSAARHHAYDLALVDLRIDAEGRPPLIRKLKQVCPDMPVVAMTLENSRKLESSTRALGVIYYMIKPVDAVNIEAIVRFLSEKQTSKLIQEGEDGNGERVRQL